MGLGFRFSFRVLSHDEKFPEELGGGLEDGGS